MYIKQKNKTQYMLQCYERIIAPNSFTYKRKQNIEKS